MFHFKTNTMKDVFCEILELDFDGIVRIDNMQHICKSPNDIWLHKGHHKNVLGYLNLTLKCEGERTELEFNCDGLRYFKTGQPTVHIYESDAPLKTEEEYFQFSLVEDVSFFDYDLYIRTVKFYNDVLRPIIDF